MRWFTTSQLPNITDGDGWAVVELATLIAPASSRSRVPQAGQHAGTQAQRIGIPEW